MRAWRMLLVLAVVGAATQWSRVAELVGRENKDKPAEEHENWYGASFAVVIGIDAYPRDSGWNRLSFAVSDAKKTADLLVKQGFEVYLMLNEEATKQNILAVITDQVRERVTPEDRFVFYFSGHGQAFTPPSGEGKLGYVIPFDGKIERTPEGETKEKLSTYLSMKEISNTLKDMAPAKHTLIVLDACFSGLLASKGLAVQKREQVDDHLRKRGTYVVSAGDSDEQVPGDGEFTRILLEGLGGGADANNDRYVDMAELDLFLDREMEKLGEERQHPFVGSLSGEGQPVFTDHKVQAGSIKASTSYSDQVEKAWKETRSKARDKDLSNTDKIDALQDFLANFKEKNPYEDDAKKMIAEIQEREDYQKKLRDRWKGIKKRASDPDRNTSGSIREIEEFLSEFDHDNPYQEDANDLLGDLQQKERDRTDANEREARERMDKDWAAVEKAAEDTDVLVQKRLDRIDDFMDKYGSGNPHAQDAERLRQRLVDEDAQRGDAERRKHLEKVEADWVKTRDFAYDRSRSKKERTKKLKAFLAKYKTDNPYEEEARRLLADLPPEIEEPVEEVKIPDRPIVEPDPGPRPNNCTDIVNKFSSCGGDPSGTWRFVSGCVDVRSMSFMGQIQAFCPTATATAALDTDLTISFASGTATSTCNRIDLEMTFDIPSMCNFGCESDETMTCTFAGSGCHCTSSDHEEGPGTTYESYSVNGDSILLTDPVGMTRTMFFCVRGRTMTVKILGDGLNPSQFLVLEKR